MEIIHIVLGKANPDRLNGVNKVVYNMATEQSKAGKNVQVWGITPNPVHDYPERNFKTVLFQAERFSFSINQALKKAILENSKAVFHVHGGWIPVFSSLARYFAKHQMKYVLTPHGAYNEVAMQRSSFRKKIYFNLFEKVLLRHAHRVHSIGRSEVDGLKKIYPKATSFLLPYGFESDISLGYSVKNTDFTIGFVGRLDTYTKGLDLLMEAFTIFQKTYPNSKLWIVGDGEGKGYLENFISEKQLKNVVLWGKKFGNEKDELISKMHIFAHPSRNEGLPTAVLEAASLGTPTIVTYATNVAEYVSAYKAGIAIENENVDALVQGIKTLEKAYITDEAKSYLDGAKRMLEEVFSWSVLVKKYDELYK
jgi:glycosyltransferase involved in cell wall biosynthesis